MPQIQYIVADGNAYAIDETGYMFGAPVFKDNSVDWEHSYEFEPCEEDAEHVAYMCKMLQDIQTLCEERKYEVLVK